MEYFKRRKALAVSLLFQHPSAAAIGGVLSGGFDILACVAWKRLVKTTERYFREIHLVNPALGCEALC
jgi:hypothetical protein